jgi:hypothetical protein
VHGDVRVAVVAVAAVRGLRRRRHCALGTRTELVATRTNDELRPRAFADNATNAIKASTATVLSRTASGGRTNSPQHIKIELALKLETPA